MSSDEPEHDALPAAGDNYPSGLPERIPLSESDIGDLIDEHHHTLARLEEDITFIAGTQEETLADVTSLRGQLDQITATLQTSSTRAADNASRWSWRHAAGEQALELGEELTDFVTWLIDRYLTDSPHRIPACWSRHPVAVEELTALMVAWQAAYCSGDKPTDRLTAWHTHHLWPVLQRLPDVTGLKRCDRGHVDLPAQRTRENGTKESPDLSVTI